MRKWRIAGSSWLLVLLILASGDCSYGQDGHFIDRLETDRGLNKPELGQIALQTLDQHAYTLSGLHKKLIALVFLSPECPLCQNYSLVLNRLQARFDRDLDIVGIFPGRSFSISACQTFRIKYHIQFLLLTDTLKRMVKLVGANITPEVFLFDQEKNLLYHGAIDNWVAALGKQRSRATENYLADGIEENLEGLAVKTKEAKAIGCFINDY